MNKFWLVFNPQRLMPKVQHKSWFDADAEARRLAAMTPGETFVVLEGVSAYSVSAPVFPPVTVRALS